MREIPMHGDLQIDEDIAFERREWTIQRVTFIVLLAIVIAGLLGALGGPGPLSAATLGESGASLRLTYERFIHVLEAHALSFEVRPTDASAGTVSLALGLDYLRDIEVQRVHPEPETVQAASDRLIYTFALASPGETIRIQFTVRATRFGVLGGRIGFESGPAFDIRQLVYP